MERTYWIKQSTDAPAFPDLLWSKPENQAHAGKLLIIGGNLYGFSAPAEAYTIAHQTGIGSARIILPESIKPVVGRVLPEGEYAPSTPSGSFSKKSLLEFLHEAAWADAVLLAGDIGRNAETAIMLESFLQKFSGLCVLTKDVIDTLSATKLITSRPDTCAVLSFAQLQKLAMSQGVTKAFTYDMSLLQLIDALHDFTTGLPLHIVTKHHDQLIVASEGNVSSTKLNKEMPIWRVATAARAAVWWLQNPAKPLEALTTALIDE